MGEFSLLVEYDLKYCFQIIECTWICIKVTLKCNTAVLAPTWDMTCDT